MKPIDDMSLDELRLEIANKKGYPDEFNQRAIPDYSRSWQAAGELLDDASVGNWVVHLQFNAEREPHERWAIELCETKSCRQSIAYICGYGRTAQEAVSRAWLKWKESSNAK